MGKFEGSREGTLYGLKVDPPRNFSTDAGEGPGDGNLWLGRGKRQKPSTDSASRCGKGRHP